MSAASPAGFEQFEDVIEALESGDVEVVVSPMYNSVIGGIYEVNDLLFEKGEDVSQLSSGTQITRSVRDDKLVICG